MAMVYAGSSLEMKNSRAPGWGAPTAAPGSSAATAAGGSGRMLIFLRPPLRTLTAMKRSNTSKSWMNVSSRWAIRSCQSAGFGAPPMGACMRRKFKARQLVRTMKRSAEVLDLVFVIAFVGQKHVKTQGRIIGLGIAPLRGHRALHVDEDEALGLGLGDAQVEALVGLREQLFVEQRILPEPMLLDVQPEQGLGILLDIEHGGIVVGPCDDRIQPR